jgi:glycosyltransferase involved in cell wall biosynthesis
MQEVCVVVPCYNEERRLRGADLLAFLDSHSSASLCLVDDGSRDRTLAVLQRLRDLRSDRILVHALTVNGGKAEAVRAGVRYVAAAGSWPIIGYWDADLSTPLSEVDRLLTVLIDTPGCQLAMGSRVKRLGSHIERRVARHVLGRLFAALASGILGLPVYDSQCGAKLFRREWVDTLFGEPFLTRWLFDLEMLARLRNQVGIGTMDAACEVPLGQWREVSGSKLRLSEMIGVPFELLKIRARYNR